MKRPFVASAVLSDERAAGADGVAAAVAAFGATDFLSSGAAFFSDVAGFF